MSERALSCPCCRSLNVGIYQDDDCFPPHSGIVCNDCGMKSPSFREIEKALRIWNRREKRDLRKVIDATKPRDGKEL